MTGKKWGMDLKLIGFAIVCLFILLGCGDDNHYRNQTPIQLDFTLDSASQPAVKKPVVKNHLSVAVSAMISPQETFSNYEALMKYIGKKMNRDVEFKQRKTYKEVNDMLKKGQLDFAFICSGAYVEARREFPINLLVVPVVNGEPVYYAYIIAHKNSNINSFKDLKGKSFAFTDPLSNTGHLYPLSLINRLGEKVDVFFSQTIYTYAHDHSIQAVARKIVDGASVDGLIFEYLKAKKPERVENVKVIGKSQEFGIPPVVICPTVDPEIKMELTRIFLHMHEDPEGKEILEELLIEKFIPGTDTAYDGIEEMMRVHRP
ncbi:MAG: phosphate/phosphite/phosphonate ABC transporter substrate-binding protein [Calditrichia bacterium]